MNTLIKEIAQQAGEAVVNEVFEEVMLTETEDGATLEVPAVFIAKFSELMIAEFSDVVKQTANELAEFYTKQGATEDEVLMRVNGALAVLGHIRERFKD